MRAGYKQTKLGEIPEDWEVVRLNSIGNIVTGSTPPTIIKEYYQDKGFLWASPADLGKRKYILNTNKQLSDIGFEQTRKLPPLSILVTCIGSTIGKIGMTNSWMATNQQINSIVCKNSNSPEFYYYVMEAMAGYIKSLAGTQAVPLLNKTDFSSIQVVCPPLPEQQKIAHILSTVDEKIDLIAEQISETQALKKGLMQRLLTRGIGHTEFKDSPLGEIPVGWEVKNLRDIAKCSVGIASSATHAYCEKGILLLRNQNIKEGKLDLKDVLYVNSEYEIQHKTKRLKADDILTVRTGYPGISAVVPKELEGSQSFTTLIIRRKDKSISSNFLCFYINSERGKSFFNSSQAGGGQKNVGTKTLETMKVPIPAIPEQQRITAILSALDKKLEIQKEKKQEYQTLKKGLMQQLLTGKIRVKTN